MKLIIYIPNLNESKTIVDLLVSIPEKPKVVSKLIELTL